MIGLNNDENAMKTKLSWICAVALGMSAVPSMMTHAAPGNPAALAAPTVPAVAPATEPVATPAPGETEALTPATPTQGQATPAPAAESQAVGQVMPGVTRANAPIVADSAPSRNVKLTFAEIAPPPGSMVLRVSTRTMALSLVCAVMKWCPKRC